MSPRLPVLVLLLLTTLPMLARAQGGPPFRTDDPDTAANKHLELNIGFIADHNRATAAYQVPDFDFNYGLGDRLQLKYEIPIALEQTNNQPGTGIDPTVLGGLGQSLMGIKWRYYEHHPGTSFLSPKNFGTGLLSLMRPAPSPSPGDAPGEKPDQPEPNLEFGTYPQLFLDNPTRSVPRGIVAPGPHFYLPVEISFRAGPVRFNADAGYDFGNKNLPQAWNRGFVVGHEFKANEFYIEFYDYQDANRLPPGRGVGNFATGGPKSRELTLGFGGRQALNKDKTHNLLFMVGRSVQTTSVNNSQPTWIAYFGTQLVFGPR